MKNGEEVWESIIIGTGPAGLTAAIYQIRASVKTLIISGNQPGGQLTITTTVENFPGFANGVGGVKLMMEMLSQVKNLGGVIKNGIVLKINQNKTSGNFEIELEGGERLESKSVIVATGASAKWLGLEKERGLVGKGISGCATCDGTLFRGKTVAIVGGGNTACEEAVFLAKITKKVYMIHRRDRFRAGPTEQKRVLDCPNIEIWWDSEVVEINPKFEILPPKADCVFSQNLSLDSKFRAKETKNSKESQNSKDQDSNEILKSVMIKNNKTGEEKILELEGLFVAIGRTPATGFVKDLVELGSEGHIVVCKNPALPTMSSMEGLFAAGDCADDSYRQAIVAAGDGAKAAMDSQRWFGGR